MRPAAGDLSLSGQKAHQLRIFKNLAVSCMNLHCMHAPISDPGSGGGCQRGNLAPDAMCSWEDVKGSRPRCNSY